MPQMAPMNWLMLFLVFTLTFLLFNSMNFYSFFYTPKKLNKIKNIKLMNWKW
uniref:ATP synthase complex subunit 8 n=1 Tax=Aleochara sp. 1 EF-2015 TaxID=1756843 RepID=A0A0S2M6E1_9COLE|nr:ATP synthase F0 subunit 8 [Aleochara sp. 1 EF-2015]